MAEACGGAWESVVLWLIVLSEEVAVLGVVVVATIVTAGAGVVITVLMGPESIV